MFPFIINKTGSNDQNNGANVPTTEHNEMNVSNLHLNLYVEIEQMHKWKIDKDVSLNQMKAKLNDANEIINAQKKSLLDMQLENENLSTHLKNETEMQQELLQKVSSTWKLHEAIQNHSEYLDKKIKNIFETKNNYKKRNEEINISLNDLTLNLKHIIMQYNDNLVNLNCKISKEKLNISKKQTELDLLNENMSKDILSMKNAIKSFEEKMQTAKREKEEWDKKCSLLVDYQAQLNANLIRNKCIKLKLYHEIKKSFEISDQITEYTKDLYTDFNHFREDFYDFKKENIKEWENVSKFLKQLIEDLSLAQKHVMSIKEKINTYQDVLFKHESYLKDLKVELEELIRINKAFANRIGEIDSHTNKLNYFSNELEAEVGYLKTYFSAIADEDEKQHIASQEHLALRKEEKVLTNDYNVLLKENANICTLNKELENEIETEKTIIEGQKNKLETILTENKNIEMCIRNFNSKIEDLQKEMELNKCQNETLKSNLLEIEKSFEKLNCDHEIQVKLKNDKDKELKSKEDLINSFIIREKEFEDVEKEFINMNNEHERIISNNKQIQNNLEDLLAKISAEENDLKIKSKNAKDLENEIKLSHLKESEAIKEKDISDNLHNSQMKELMKHLEMAQQEYHNSLESKENQIFELQTQLIKLKESSSFSKCKSITPSPAFAKRQKLEIYSDLSDTTPLIAKPLINTRQHKFFKSNTKNDSPKPSHASPKWFNSSYEMSD